MAKKIKCHSDESFGNKRVKRGKPRKQETQIMVGEPGSENYELRLGLIYSVDKCLPSSNRYRIWLIKYYFDYKGEKV